MPIDLIYDTLPPGSFLRREINRDGSVTISISAGEINERARRAALRDTSILSACVTALFATIIWLTIDQNLSNRWPDDRLIMPLLRIALGVFLAALFLFIWKIWFSNRREKLERAAQQSTVVNLREGQLTLETAGPFGTESKSLKWGDEWTFNVSIAPKPNSSVPCLRIERPRNDITLFPGLSKSELKWIFNEMVRVIIHPRQT